ncbi:hypothetical protein EUA93_21130 [Nocardioides oleivorans]|uniref:Collagen-like protein n=1 Tax=Nocardioides oleivorans TaxID=273676 RepID=A0A4V1RJU1_9ACTN|nr:hypothetical protein [Nocardioides oleivorans]RYB89962.1 hypothetical protein EUA93_21130 [Nocardioides oleivorans]
MPRLSAPVAVVVSAALLASVGAGSYAAGTLVTSKQIKDGTIKVEDLSPKAVERLRGSVGPTGAAGPAGATGATGGQGARGVSSWDRIPSGQTVTGRESFFFTATAGGQVSSATLSLPARPTQPLVSGTNVFMAPGSPIGPFGTWNPSCSGSVAAPTAPAGWLCVYGEGTNVWTNPAGPYWSGERAVVIRATATTTGEISATLSWAYTAP